MPRSKRCTICKHADVDKIDRALVGGGIVTRLSALFRVSPDALDRHKGRHLPEKLTQAQEAQEQGKADSLMTELRELHQKTLALMEKCEEAGDLRAALTGVREARGNLDLLGRLLETKELEEKLANLEKGGGGHVPDFLVQVYDGEDK